MSLVVINDDYFKDIGDSIRTKLGTDDKFKVAEFAEKIDAIEQEYTPPTTGLLIKDYDTQGYPSEILLRGMTSIPDNYFAGCFKYDGVFKNLNASLKLPSDLVEIGENAFKECAKLELDKLPDSITTIKASAFESCTNLNLDSLPESLKIIGNNAFKSCSNLELKKLNDNLESIGDYAFYYCSKLTLDSLPNNIVKIPNNCFYRCTNLTINELPPNLTELGPWCLAGCTGITISELPDSITSIGDYAFADSTQVALTKLPYSLVTIGQQAFRSCSKLAIKAIPKGVMNIYGYTFQNTPITEITFEGPIKNIASNAFTQATKLSKIVLGNVTTPPTLGSGAFSTTAITSSSGVIQVPHNLIDTFKAASGWSSYKNIIKGIDLEKINIESSAINIKYHNTCNIIISYNDGVSAEALGEYAGYTLTCSDNATLNGDVLTLNEGVQVGDVVTVTATSTHNPEITTTSDISIVYYDAQYLVNLNAGEWVDSGTTVDGNIVYKSDVGSYHKASGKSIATLVLRGVSLLKLYIRSYAESNYDYVEAFEIDTPASRGAGKFTTKGKQSQTNYVECIYNLDGGDHTIDIMYSKDAGGDSGDDRGYFYIGHYE